MHLLIGKVIELLFPGQFQHRVDVDQAQEVGFETLCCFERLLGPRLIKLFYRPMQEVDGFLLLASYPLGLPVMDAPVRHSDKAENATDFLECVRVSKKDTEDPEQWNQPSWCPVQDLDTTESIGDVLACDKNTPNHYGRDTEPCSDRFQLR